MLMTHAHSGRLIKLLRALTPVAAVLFVTALTLYAIFSEGRKAMVHQLREELLTAVTVATTGFRGEELQSIHGQDDMQTDVFRNIVARLRAVRASNASIRFAYIMRRTADPSKLEFVADADSLATLADLDVNRNGVLDDNERPSYPGDPYDISGVPPLQHAAFEHPALDDSPTSDQWGSSLSAYAPIRASSGAVSAVLGIDMESVVFAANVRRFFSPLAILISTLASLVLVGYIAIVSWKRRVEREAADRLGHWNRVLEQKVEEKTRELKEANEAKTEFLQVTYHQLKAPLARLKLALSTVDEIGWDKLPMEQATSLKDAEENTKYLSDTLDTMRQFSLLQARRVSIEPVAVHIQEIVVQLVEHYGREMRSKQQQFSFDCAPLLSVRTDPTIVREIIAILLSNAIAYTPEKGKLSVHAARDGERVRIEIADTGAGIPADQQRKLFTKFFRASNTAKLQQGMGLGLYLAKSLTLILGGEISFVSTVGKGTTFSVVLPDLAMVK